MNKPKVDKPYVFVRVVDNRIEQAVFVRFSDDSALFNTDKYETSVDPSCNDGSWRNRWTTMQSQGFVEVAEAKAAGFIPQDWEPTIRIPVVN